MFDPADGNLFFFFFLVRYFSLSLSVKRRNGEGKKKCLVTLVRQMASRFTGFWRNKLLPAGLYSPRDWDREILDSFLSLSVC